jgi:hypothetical protein
MGQITLDSWLGNFLREICKKHPEIKTVVEIGTWDGMGSTDCVIQGFLESEKTDIKFVSLESNPQMYQNACGAWKDRLPEWASLVHGRVVDESEMDSSDLSDQEKVWFKEDVDGMATCPNVAEDLPENIDLLILDGGEFSTKSEFLKLVSRSSIVVLDDTRARKCNWIREHALQNTDKYELIFDAPDVRGGIMAFSVME